MGKQILYAGIILLILGFVFWLGIGPLIAFSAVTALNASLVLVGATLSWIGIIFIPIGIILTIVGAIVAPKTVYNYNYPYQPTQQPSYYPPPVQPVYQNLPPKFCQNCGSKINGYCKFCPECGNKII